MLAIALAIAEVGHRGPGKWHVEKTGRRDVTLSYTTDARALREFASPDPGLEGTEAYTRTIWQQFGGLDILEHAGILAQYYTNSLDWFPEGTTTFFCSIPCGG
jgi:hypothetical protein